MNWAKFRDFLRKEYKVDKAFMFIGYIPENESLYDQMHDAGYMVVLKPTFDVTKPRQEQNKNDKSDDRVVKGNIDADLVLWAMKEMPNYDKAIIVSGDGDFYSLIEYLSSKKRLLHVFTPNSHYSRLYNSLESSIVDLSQFRHVLAYRSAKRPKR